MKDTSWLTSNKDSGAEGGSPAPRLTTQAPPPVPSAAGRKPIAEALGQIADTLIQRGEFGAIEMHLREAIRALPVNAQPSFSLRVWKSLVDYHLHEDAEGRLQQLDQALPHSPIEFARLVSGIDSWGVVWLEAAGDPDDTARDGWGQYAAVEDGLEVPDRVR